MDEIRSLLRHNYYDISEHQRQGEEQQVSYKGLRTRLVLGFWTVTLTIRRLWSKVFKILWENDFQCKILYLTKLSILCEVRIKTFSDTWGLQNFTLCTSFSGDYWRKLHKNEGINQESTGSKKQGCQQNREWRESLGLGERKITRQLLYNSPEEN